MCGRFTLHSPAEVLVKQFQLPGISPFEPRYNIAPSQPIAVVRISAEASERVLETMRWGLVPSWAEDPRAGDRMINARAETLTHKPAFRAAYRYRRCLILADGFYEWGPFQGRKWPYYIRMKDQRPFAFAGLWEHWERADLGALDSCTIITTEANERVQAIHERMPAILAPQHYGLWLDRKVTDTERLQGLIAPYPAQDLTAYPVSPRVNSPKNDDAGLIAPLAPSTEGQ
jgi:putative SOS response-associated peptidase YedK